MRNRSGRTGVRTLATSKEPSLRAPARFGLAAIALAIATSLACGQPANEPASDLTLRIPELDLDGMEARVMTRLRQTRAAVVAEPQSTWPLKFPSVQKTPSIPVSSPWSDQIALGKQVVSSITPSSTGSKTSSVGSNLHPPLKMLSRI